MPSPAVPSQPPGRGPADAAASPALGGLRRDDEWGWDGDDWDLAQSLNAEEIAALAALDCADDPAGGWADDGGGPPQDGGAWPGGPWPPDRGPGGAPAETLPGLLPRRLGTGGGFDAGGVADRLPPGPVLAGLAADKWADGLGQVSDDELAGMMIAWRRIASWAAAGEFAAVAELARRREVQAAAGADRHLAEHVADEIAMVLTLTSWAADTLVDRAEGLARLPKTRAALAAGEIDVPKALVILGELAGLDGVHAARVEAAVIGRAGGWTTGELRRAVHRQVIAADPAAARRRKEEAERRARVERWAEDAGTAALAGRDLPPAGVLAADAHLTGWATRLKAAGLAGTLDQLRAQVYLALLNGQAPETLLPTGAPGPGRPTEAPAEGHSTGTRGQPNPADAGSQSGPTGTRGQGEPTGTCDRGHRADAVADGEPTGTGACGQGLPGSGRPGTDGGPGEAVAAPSPEPGPPPRSAAGPVRGSVHLVLPLATWLGWSAAPGEVSGFGPLDATDSEALAAALARDPATTWCLTITGPDGRPAAHGCAKTGPGQPPHHRTGPRAGPGPPPPPGLRTWLDNINLAWLETGPCSHRRQSPGYRPSRALTHLIQVRQGTCTAPGCRRPATACDFEHTIPYHAGGRTCECNAGPCCRRHHRAKQTPGWQLAQPTPGTFTWTTPHGRSYQTHPGPYPI